MHAERTAHRQSKGYFDRQGRIAWTGSVISISTRRFLPTVMSHIRHIMAFGHILIATKKVVWKSTCSYVVSGRLCRLRLRVASSNKRQSTIYLKSCWYRNCCSQTIIQVVFRTTLVTWERKVRPQQRNQSRRKMDIHRDNDLPIKQILGKNKSDMHGLPSVGSWVVFGAASERRQVMET